MTSPDQPEIVLHDYFRSSASYRVRIVLKLKRVAYRSVPTSLLEGENKAAAYVARNPQGFVPMLSVGDTDLTQSLAIIDWLDATYPDPPMVPSDPLARAKVLAAALVIAADIHPVDNLRVLKYLKNTLGHDQTTVDDWYRHWIIEGFDALEQLAPREGLFGGDTPNLADICLVPQMYNARRFATPLDAFPRLVRIDAALQAIDAIAAAHPDAVKPAD
ncbi:maleylacetoacetate isomerase [Sphingorhabdus soli]|uniref:Maleylacetoacetate isomerase n=1 Tax=Flavisphingopyxis soli TaxID=2601267 RepID=A0A5C6UAI0_9SPHN|nr:maleylacetoacetate isomerase [Sphingorhabdus soli]TXC68698.1 maleylacetoacetate isomerase [Sphingorhabdus soli]